MINSNLFSNELDLSLYDANQIHEICDAQDKGLDVTVMLNPKFSYLQLNEIKLGLFSGVNVNFYLDPKIPAFRMHKCRENLELIKLNKISGQALVC